MNHPTGPGRRRESDDRLDTVLRYHTRTKHHFARYAAAPGGLDWANQPNPFRRYAGCPLLALPRLGPDDAPASPPYDALYEDAIASAALGAASLSRFLEWSLAISAWKQAGDVRWALRTNPSSGNLHPTEAYVLVERIAELSASPGLYHYAAREHALERRADWTDAGFGSLMRAFPPRAFLLGLASVNWRETWKYGERAFRYCQHDVGHAIGSARIAARLLGWHLVVLDGTSDPSVAALLGLDREADFAGAEREHPDCLAVVWPADAAIRPTAAQPVTLPLCIDADALLQPPPCTWHGQADRLSRGEPVHWELISQVEAASLKPGTEPDRIALRAAPRRGEAAGGAQDAAAGAGPAQPRADQLIRQRRSALAFDAATSISADRFFAMLARVMPRVERDVGDRPVPWDALPWAPAVHLALFVHRVQGLAPGLYMLVRDASKLASLRRATYREYAWRRPAGCPGDLPLFVLQEADTRLLSAQLSCGQDIAGDGAFSLGMIAEFESTLRQRGPWFYRRLFWETGVIGQLLYLEAEAAGVRATGIGCFFDDPVHQVLGLGDAAFQSLYHFTVGTPVDDPRLTTLPPYGLDH